MAEAKRDQNHVTVALGVSSVDGSTPLMFTIDPVTGRLRTDASGSGGIVESVVGTADRITVDSTDPANPIVNIALTYVGQNTITTLGTVTTGTWNATVLTGQYGGTGVANTGKTITIGGNFTMSGAFTFTGTITGNTSVTFPTSGTLATTGDIANMVTAAATFATDESILRSDGTSRGAQATSTNATLTDAGALVLASTATAGSFIPSSSSAPTNGLYLPAANTLGLAINGSGEVQLTATAFSPVADGGNSLGTTALGWQNLFGNTGFVINIENSDWVATHTAGILTVGTGDLRVTTAGTNTASVVTVGGTQTLTNKTLTAPVIATIVNSGTLTLPTSTDTLVGRATTDTLTNKRITARVTALTSSATPTFNTDDCDAVDITALAAAITDMSANMTGTPTNKQRLIFQIKDNGTARAIAWGTGFVAGGVALPTTTVISKILTVGFIYNTANSLNKWMCVASAQEA